MTMAFLIAPMVLVALSGLRCARQGFRGRMWACLHFFLKERSASETLFNI